MGRTRTAAGRVASPCLLAFGAVLVTAALLLLPGRLALAAHGPEPSSQGELLQKCGAANDSGLSLEQFRSAIICLYNAERSKHRRVALKRNPILEGAAQGHVRDVLERDYFSHVSPEGVGPSERARRAGYLGLVAENINLYCSTVHEPRPFDIFLDWLDLADHHRNMVGSGFRDIGVGVAKPTPLTPGCGITVVVKLGQPASSGVSTLPNGGRLIRGGAGDSRLVGTPGDDVILCQNGDDTVVAGAGNDFIDCKGGNDTINAGAGNDRVRAGAGRDRVRGKGGRDRVRAGAGRDRVRGGPGRDRIGGSAGRDRLYGNGGRDRLLGGPGRDRLLGGAGADRLIGGLGFDRLRGGPGRDWVTQ